jgi:CHAD domain-containing protein
MRDFVGVAARRARAVLRATRPILDRDWSEPLRAELKWLGGALGPRRDLDVLLGHLRLEIGRLEQPERTAAETLADSLSEERESAQALALEALSSERYFALLDVLEAAARGPKVRRGSVALRELAAREFRRLRKAAEGAWPRIDGQGAAPSPGPGQARSLRRRAREPRAREGIASFPGPCEGAAGRARRAPGRDRRRGPPARAPRRSARLWRGVRSGPPGRA